MKYQAFRRISTDELSNAIFTTAGSTFDAAETESRRLEIAAALGIPESDLEAIEQATKPAASRQTISLPTDAVTPKEAAQERALVGIIANRNTAPWGQILYDQAVGDGRI